MAYLNGTFQYFDNSFLYQPQDYRKPIVKQYSPDSLFGYLQQYHPKWFMIMEKAHRLDYFFQDSYTMFIPQEESLDEEFMLTFDRQTALQLFNYHTTKGFYEKANLETSKFQYINTLIQGGDPIFVISNGQNITLNNNACIIKYNIQFGNIILHIISNPI